jgi:hypothetical protein
MERAHNLCPKPPPALLMAGSFCPLLEAIDIHTQQFVHPVTSGMPNLTDREKVILGLYCRSVGFCRAASELIRDWPSREAGANPLIPAARTIWDDSPTGSCVPLERSPSKDM